MLKFWKSRGGELSSRLSLESVGSDVLRLTLATPRPGEDCRLRVRLHRHDRKREFSHFDLPLIHVTGLLGSVELKWSANGGGGLSDTLTAPIQVPNGTIINLAANTVTGPDGKELSAGTYMPLFNPSPFDPEKKFLGWTTAVPSAGNLHDMSGPTPADHVETGNWYHANAADTARRSITITQDTTLYAIWGYNVKTDDDMANVGSNDGGLLNEYNTSTGQPTGNIVTIPLTGPFLQIGYYSLQNDVRVTEALGGVNPYGGKSFFNGVFEGNGKTVTLNIVTPVEIKTSWIYPVKAASLFSQIAGATVRNLSLEGYINVHSGNSTIVVSPVGGVSSAPYNTGSIKTIASSVAITIDATGQQNGSRKLDVIVGGIVASASNITIQNCYADGNITVNGTDPARTGAVFAGGIVGIMQGGELRSCLAANTVQGSRVGGIVGEVRPVKESDYTHGEHDPLIINCVALNPGIKNIWNMRFFGRIAGFKNADASLGSYDTEPFENNYADTGMVPSWANGATVHFCSDPLMVAGSDPDPTISIDGTNVAYATYTDKSWWQPAPLSPGARWTSATGCGIANNKETAKDNQASTPWYWNNNAPRMWFE